MPSRIRRPDPDARDQVKSVYKEFVVIGNGPSGIALSYFLSGHWPYYTGVTSDPFLHARLEEQSNDTSLVEQDLFFLADGLEGRSNNPVALLFDALQRPEADLGKELPSLLEWRFNKDNSTDHVVLGRGKPGGVWQTIEGDMLTVSLGGWMELPNLSMAEWKASSAYKEKGDPSRRATVDQVSQYYLDYIDIMGIEDNFANNTIVTGVKRLACKEMICPQTKYKKSASLAINQDLIPEIKRKFSCPANVALLSSSNESSSCCSSKSQQIKPNPRERVPSIQFDLDDDEKFDIDDITSDCSSLTQSIYSSGLEELHSSPSECECRSSSSPTTSPASPPISGRYYPESPPISGRYYPDNCDIFDECSGRDASVDMFMGCEVYDDSCICPSWDPILNPSLFSSSFVTLGSSLPKDTMSRSVSFQPSSFRRCDSISNSYKKPGSSYRKPQCPVQDCSEDEILYEVTGVTLAETDRVGTPFKYLAKNIVLATGMTDEPKKLDVPGEDLPFVLHSLHHLEDAVRKKLITTNSDPVLVVGAGLSAADAIINIQGHNIPVVHAFRRPVDDRTLIFNKLPVAIYPEYHEVHKMMAAGVTGTSRMVHGQAVDAEYAGYRAFPETEVAEITSNRRVRLNGPNTNEFIQVSYVVVLIGASPDLNFLEEKGENLGRLSGPIDRNNPIDIDVFTHESINVPGLYAMGPLTGDNFVRFLQGGALAITSDIYHKKKTEKDKTNS